MALVGTLTQDTPNVTQSIVFSQGGSPLDSVTYTAAGLTYPIASTFTLSQSDFALFYLYKSQFYNALISNYPTFYGNISKERPASQWRLLSSSAPNLNTYNQTTTMSYNLVYNMTCDRNAKTVGFQNRSAVVTITPQEYLLAYQLITLFANQVALL